MKNDKVVLIAIIAITFFLGKGLGRIKERDIIENQNKLDYNMPYDVKILNEHEVQCIFERDTVRLFFENAYALSEERIIFIQK